VGIRRLRLDKILSAADDLMEARELSKKSRQLAGVYLKFKMYRSEILDDGRISDHRQGMYFFEVAYCQSPAEATC
jgi:hypothetical protein